MLTSIPSQLVKFSNVRTSEKGAFTQSCYLRLLKSRQVSDSNRRRPTQPFKSLVIGPMPNLTSQRLEPSVMKQVNQQLGGHGQKVMGTTIMVLTPRRVSES